MVLCNKRLQTKAECKVSGLKKCTYNIRYDMSLSSLEACILSAVIRALENFLEPLHLTLFSRSYISPGLKQFINVSSTRKKRWNFTMLEMEIGILSLVRAPDGSFTIESSARSRISRNSITNDATNMLMHFIVN